MAYYQKIQELADAVIATYPTLNQEQICRKVHNQIGENPNTIRDTLLFMRRYKLFCEKGEQLNKKVIDYLILQNIVPHSIREVTTCIYMGTASAKDKRDLIAKKISLKQFLVNSRVKVTENISDVCEDIKNLDTHYKPTENDTVNLFLSGVARLEQTLEVILSPHEGYAATFGSMSDSAKSDIKDGCDRIEQIKQVIFSVI